MGRRYEIPLAFSVSIKMGPKGRRTVEKWILCVSSRCGIIISRFVRPTSGLSTISVPFRISRPRKATAARSCSTATTEWRSEMAFPSPAVDYVESRINLNELFIQHPSAKSVMDAGDVRHFYHAAVQPKAGDEMCFELFGE